MKWKVMGRGHPVESRSPNMVAVSDPLSSSSLVPPGTAVTSNFRQSPGWPVRSTSC